MFRSLFSLRREKWRYQTSSIHKRICWAHKCGCTDYNFPKTGTDLLCMSYSTRWQNLAAISSINVLFEFLMHVQSISQVSTNGFVSFGPSTPNSLYMSSFPASTIPLVAPLWADFDFRISGSVYHRVSQDDYILDKAASLIASRNQDFVDYRPTLCVIVTWLKAVLFSTTFHNTQVSFIDKILWCLCLFPWLMLP